MKMVWIAALAISALIYVIGEPVMATDSDPQVVSEVDLNRYSGTWYDIAHSPNFFQRNCVRSKAEYAVTSATSISVKNTCYKENGATSDIEGTAKIVDASQPAKLKVRFNFFARGDYWIIDLDPNYQWSVVSGPQKKSLFILSRQTPMAPETLEKILNSLKEKGFRTDEFVFGRY